MEHTKKGPSSFNQSIEDLRTHRRTLEMHIENHPPNAEERLQEKGFESLELVLNQVVELLDCVMRALEIPDLWTDKGHREVSRWAMGVLDLISNMTVSTPPDKIHAMFVVCEQLHNFVHTMIETVKIKESLQGLLSQIASGRASGPVGPLGGEGPAGGSLPN